MSNDNINLLESNSKMLLLIDKYLHRILEECPIQTIHELFLADFKESFYCDYCGIALFVDEAHLELVSNNSKERITKITLIDAQKIKMECKGNEASVLINESKIKEVQDFFNLKGIFSSLLIHTIKYYDTIIGFFLIARQTKATFSNEEKQIIKILTNIISNNYINMFFTQAYKEQIDELRNIIKQLRHDFANDIQSLALALELLDSTEMTIEQRKFFAILVKAKNSTLEKLANLREKKEQHEEKIAWDLGILSK